MYSKMYKYACQDELYDLKKENCELQELFKVKDKEMRVRICG